MKMNNTLSIVTIEVTLRELNEKGFDKVWDEIRMIYPAHEYELEQTENKYDGKIIVITLKSLKHYLS